MVGVGALAATAVATDAVAVWVAAPWAEVASNHPAGQAGEAVVVWVAVARAAAARVVVPMAALAE